MSDLPSMAINMLKHSIIEALMEARTELELKVEARPLDAQEIQRDRETRAKMEGLSIAIGIVRRAG